MLLTRRQAIATAALLAVLAGGGGAAPVPAERARAEKELAAVAAKLHGRWTGGPCDGEIALRENGTYEWTGIGPGGESHEGTWALRGEPTAPVLTLTCKTADAKDREGRAEEFRLLRLDERGLAVKRPEAQKPMEFVRTKCEDRPLPREKAEKAMEDNR